jgi:uncharacterized membrane protein YeaQ/YmgE (transglycosylase-associated protein family)
MVSALSGGSAILVLVLMTLVGGLIVGGLARWIMPGPDPMSIGQTILLGIGGSILGGIVAAVFRLSPVLHPGWIFLLEVAGALLVLWLVKHYRKRDQTLHHR